MAGRPKSFDMDQALEACMDVFWTKGYQGTSVDDLQQAIGIKRGSFYASFGCKDDVFASVLLKYWDEATEAGLKHLDGNDTPRQSIANHIRYVGDFMTQNTPRGCLLLSSSSDAACAASAEAGLVAKRMQILETRVCNVLSREDSGLSKQEARGLTAYALTTLLGLNAMAKTGQDADNIRAAADFAAKSVLSA
jgi:TetR/AcrR family transcriptional regulator, transcriptional repressor for nem operon